MGTEVGGTGGHARDTAGPEAGRGGGQISPRASGRNPAVEHVGFSQDPFRPVTSRACKIVKVRFTATKFVALRDSGLRTLIQAQVPMNGEKGHYLRDVFHVCLLYVQHKYGNCYGNKQVTYAVCFQASLSSGGGLGRQIQGVPWEFQGQGGAEEGAERALLETGRFQGLQGHTGHGEFTAGTGLQGRHAFLPAWPLTSFTAPSQIRLITFSGSLCCCKKPMVFAKHVALLWGFHHGR